MTATVTILNVDDTEAMRYAKTRVLARAGFQVLEAATGGEALSEAVRAKPDLVVLDVRLPDISGLDVCRVLKEQHPSVLVLQTSATLTRLDDRVRGLDSGADSYLTGPVEPEELLAAVRALLRMRRAEQAVQEADRRWQVTFDAMRDGIGIVGTDGLIVQGNAALAAMAGVTQSQLAGQPFSALFPGSLPDGGNLHRRPAELERGGRLLRLSCDPIGGPDGGRVCTVSDITAEREAERGLKEALAQKDMLFKEVNHRVKNSLQLVSSLLQLQRFSLTDPALGPLLDDAVSRVNAVAAVHERLYRSDKVSSVPIGDYLRHLCEQLALSAASSGRAWTIDVDSSEEEVPTDSAIPMALIVNELVTNAIKHSQAPDGRRSIVVSYGLREGGRRLSVRDHGVGVPEGFSLQRSGGSLGMRIVTSLARQLGGTLEVRHMEPGALFSVLLPGPAAA